MDELIKMDPEFIRDFTQVLLKVRESAKKRLGENEFKKLIGTNGKLRYSIREYPVDPDDCNLEVQLNLTEDHERDVRIIMEMMKTEYSKLFKIKDQYGKASRQFVAIVVLKSYDNRPGYETEVSGRYLV